MCFLLSMMSTPLHQSIRVLLRGAVQGAAQGNVNTRRNQARPQPYPDESPCTAAARAARSVAPGNRLTDESPTGAAPLVSTVITLPNTRAAAARARGAPAVAQAVPAAPVIPAAARRTLAAPSVFARPVATTATSAPAPAAVATAGAHAGLGRTVAPQAMPANLVQDFGGEAFAQRGCGIAMQGGGATRRGQGEQGVGTTQYCCEKCGYACNSIVCEGICVPQTKICDSWRPDFNNNKMYICQCMAATPNVVDNQISENW